MATAESPAYQTVRRELGRAIRTRREDCPPMETARRLLAYDRPGHAVLVGIDYDATRAVLYHEAGRYAVAVRFGPDGLADGGVEIARFRAGVRLRTWVETMGEYWGWVHPRYR